MSGEVALIAISLTALVFGVLTLVWVWTEYQSLEGPP